MPIKKIKRNSEALSLDEIKITEEQKKMIETFSIALPKLRKELGVSQTVLGKKIGMSRQMVSLIERGINPMSWSVFLSIALFFKVNYGKDKKNLNDLDHFLLVDSSKE